MSISDFFQQLNGFASSLLGQGDSTPVSLTDLLKDVLCLCFDSGLPAGNIMIGVALPFCTSKVVRWVPLRSFMKSLSAAYSLKFYEVYKNG